ncbi:hypothetical protein AK812_SmicGene37711 [Symbiodinium microadriaticum]|uniref:Uncharacterized protein n=1 Tax=Symbiodinium microadriaticum TaxID=2951 RepID=A0A1Q9CFM1_SYMMI|nr:hypothetical protein AK812_SmicGene37711 [Symbiodinium microadriaticum]
MPINFDWFDLGPFASSYFVETGLFHGEGALKALSSGLFRQVISIEVNAELVERAREKLKLPLAAGLLKVVHDDSCNLWHHIQDLHEPCTFFLDAHGYWVQECPASSGDPESDDRDPDSQSPCPLLAELEAIAQHPLARQHKVLIDDRRCLQPGWEHPTQSWWRGLTEEMVLEKLRKVNPDFQIQFIDGLKPQDIIAAVPPECLMEMLRAERRQLVKELALRRRAPWPHPAAAALLRRQWQGGVEGEPPPGNRLTDHKTPTSPPTSPKRPGRLRERLEEEEDRLRREATDSTQPLSEAQPRDKIGEALHVPPVALAGGFPRKSSPSRARDLAGLDSRSASMAETEVDPLEDSEAIAEQIKDWPLNYSGELQKGTGHSLCRRCLLGSIRWGGRCPYDNTPIPAIVICGAMGTGEYAVYHEKLTEASGLTAFWTAR